MSEAIRKLLEHPTWPEGLEVRRVYERAGDDGDGSTLTVMFTDDGDAYVGIFRAGRVPEAARFCTLQGGGNSLRTRAALLILAEAVQLDNEERPQS